MKITIAVLMLVLPYFMYFITPGNKPGLDVLNIVLTIVLEVVGFNILVEYTEKQLRDKIKELI